MFEFGFSSSACSALTLEQSRIRKKELKSCESLVTMLKSKFPLDKVL